MFPHSRSHRLSDFGLLLFSLIILAPVAGHGQTREAVKQQAETQLKQMTPEQIDAKIKEYGMTREQAEAKAQELGIDLNSYLQQVSPAIPTPETITSDTTAQEAAKAQTPKEKKETPVPSPTGKAGLPYFGYDVFATTPAAFEPTAVGPVDPEYIVGPGDVLRVVVWGQVELQNELTVDKEGRIFIPTVGQVMVSGQTMDATYTRLKAQMSKSYSGLVSHPPTVWLDVTLAKLRPKRVFIMGEVSKPGGYTVSSYATVFSTLFSVGGPTVRGTLRDVRVIRDNRTITHVDLYNYLVGADSTNDIRVQNNDIVFVPPRGKTVSISRGVLRPAIYELLPGENLSALLEYAAGVRSTAYLERIQVDRIIPFSERKPGALERKVIDLDFRAIVNAHKDYELDDGDAITVYSILDDRMNVVTLTGAVYRPGIFQLEKTPSIKTLIEAADGPEAKAFLGVAHLIRYNDDMITKRTIPFDLGKALSDPEFDWMLMPRDEIIVFSTEAIEVKLKSVTIRGEVKSPGKYLLNDNMTLGDLVLLAGGFTEAADITDAEVSRVLPHGISGDPLVLIMHPKLSNVFDANGRNVQGDTASEASLTALGQFVLQNHDEVLIKPNPEYSLQRNVTVEGDIMYPGVYALDSKGEHLSSILSRAGGMTKTSYLGGAEFYRSGKRLLVDFQRAFLDKDPVHDVVMLADDRIKIPPHPSTVLVTGEVNGSGLLSFIRGNSVSDYIDRAGGLTDSSDFAVVTYPNGEKRKVNFGFLRSDPEVEEGSAIFVTKVPPPPPTEKGESAATTVKDLFAILSAAATIIFIVWQTTK